MGSSGEVGQLVWGLRVPCFFGVFGGLGSIVEAGRRARALVVGGGTAGVHPWGCWSGLRGRGSFLLFFWTPTGLQSFNQSCRCILVVGTPRWLLPLAWSALTGPEDLASIVPLEFWANGDPISLYRLGCLLHSLFLLQQNILCFRVLGLFHCPSRVFFLVLSLASLVLYVLHSFSWLLPVSVCVLLRRLPLS